MVRFGFFSKEDSKEEIYSSAICDTVEEAINLFSVTKKLSVEDFNNLYRVKTLD